MAVVRSKVSGMVIIVSVYVFFSYINVDVLMRAYDKPVIAVSSSVRVVIFPFIGNLIILVSKV